ncbi:hypothetical protein ACNOYE_32960 [Nannocystaceae bacterium ST9]
MSARAILIFAGLVLAGCSGGGSRSGERPGAQVDEGPRSEPNASGADSTPREANPAARIDEDRPLRVLVTGFHDWRELGDPPAIWRCRDNPSCRLLIGAARLDASGPPDRLAGPLVERLQRAAPSIEWSFRTLPVTWGAFSSVPREHDVIINIGLGVYDRFDALQLERGAYNLQAGADALGVEANGPIDESEGNVLDPPAGSPIAGRIDALVGRTIAGFTILGAAARAENSYLCNQTHWFALASVDAEGEQGPREVYFLHIPYAKDDDYAPLADAVAGVVLELVDR